MGVTIPVAVTAFPDEVYQVQRSWAERAYPKLIHYNKVEKGGHFAAWEQPELFTKRSAPGSRRCASHPRNAAWATASTSRSPADRIDGVGEPSVLALHPLLTGDLTLAG